MVSPVLTPFYERDGITIFCGDCRDILPNLINCNWFCFTDPPYNVGKDYSGWNDSLPDDEYLTFTAIWIAEIKRLCPESCIFAPNKYYLDYWNLLGREFKQITLTWSTNTGALRNGWIGQTAGLLTNAIPKASCSNWWLNVQARRMGYFFKENDFNHPGYTSEDLTSRVLTLLADPDSTIIDPFVGTGTTLKIAQDLGRLAIGIEYNEDYCRIAVDRLRQPSFFSLPTMMNNKLKPEQAAMELE